MTKNISIVTIEHKRVKVSVKIDYDNMEVSLVEKVENSNYKAKQFLFTNRGLEYMTGWENVIEAQLVAIRYGREELKKRQEEKEAEIVNMAVEIGEKLEEPDETATIENYKRSCVKAGRNTNVNNW